MASWRYVVALGSNIRPGFHLGAALDRLEARVRVLALSSVYETEPVGAPGSPNFWNSAVLIESDHTPASLKREVLRPIESELGRVRGQDRNAPRTVDLDIVLSTYDGPPVAGLELPDPDLLRYPHLAVPIAEVAGDWRVAGWPGDVSELASQWAGELVAIDVAEWRLDPE